MGERGKGREGKESEKEREVDSSILL